MSLKFVDKGFAMMVKRRRRLKREREALSVCVYSYGEQRGSQDQRTSCSVLSQMPKSPIRGAAKAGVLVRQDWHTKQFLSKKQMFRKLTISDRLPLANARIDDI